MSVTFGPHSSKANVRYNHFEVAATHGVILHVAKSAIFAVISMAATLRGTKTGAPVGYNIAWFDTSGLDLVSAFAVYRGLGDWRLDYSEHRTWTSQSSNNSGVSGQRCLGWSTSRRCETVRKFGGIQEHSAVSLFHYAV
jgi:hypothetical protein